MTEPSAVDDVHLSRQVEMVRIAFSRHGHGFHYAVAKECARLREGNKSAFRLDTTEFPVEVNGVDLHIDIVMRSSWALLVIECKRVNPAVSTWCFARSVLSSRKASEPQQVRLERAFFDRSLNRTFVARDQAERSEYQYHVGIEMRDPTTKGDPQGTGRGALGDALTQVLRGANGMVNMLSTHPELLTSPAHGMAPQARVIPVVVTTARLLVCDTDLSESALASGNLPENIQLAERKWIWFRGIASASIRHRVQRSAPESERRPPPSLGDLLSSEYAQSVGVVSWDGLEDFLTAARYHSGDD